MNNLVKLIDTTNFEALVAQINRDVTLAGIDSDTFNNVETPEELISRLQNFIDVLVSNYQESFSNFMYRVDVPEKEVNAINKGEMTHLIDEITFFVLKREMQKVYFRKKFSKP